MDGTSCTMKSSILHSTQQYVTKIQQQTSAININTLFPSMIGYICYGIEFSKKNGKQYFDRSPLNSYEWCILWRILNDFYMKYGFVIPNENEHYESLQLYKRIFTNLKHLFIYRFFRQYINGIAIINSDYEFVDKLRLQRNNGTDIERSRWKFYTYLQNLMYEILYPTTHIDLYWFKDMKNDSIVKGISKFLNETLNNLPKIDINNNNNEILTLLKTNDLTLDNFSTHIYRSIGRHYCKTTIDNNNDDDDDLFKTLPNFLDINNSLKRQQLMNENEMVKKMKFN